MTPAQVTTAAEQQHRDSLRRKAFREREVRAIRAEHVRDSGLTAGELREWSARLKRETLERHPEWRLAA